MNEFRAKIKARYKDSDDKDGLGRFYEAIDEVYSKTK